VLRSTLRDSCGRGFSGVDRPIGHAGCQRRGQHLPTCVVATRVIRMLTSVNDNVPWVTAAVLRRGPTAPSWCTEVPAQMGSGAGALDAYGVPASGALRKGGTMPPTSDSARHVHPVQGAVTAASASRSPRQARAARRRRHRMMLYLGLSLLGDRRFRKDAIIGAISLAVLAHLARESQVHARARLVAWWDALPGPADQASAGDRPATDRAA
jgi:hypothetical protein